MTPLFFSLSLYCTVLKEVPIPERAIVFVARVWCVTMTLRVTSDVFFPHRFSSIPWGRESGEAEGQPVEDNLEASRGSFCLATHTLR